MKYNFISCMCCMYSHCGMVELGTLITVYHLLYHKTLNTMLFHPNRCLLAYHSMTCLCPPSVPFLLANSARDQFYGNAGDEYVTLQGSPSLLKLFSEKCVCVHVCMCVCTIVCLFTPNFIH